MHRAEIAGDGGRRAVAVKVLRPGIERRFKVDLDAFTFAARAKGAGLQSTQFFLSPEPNVTYSACLVGKIEELFETGRAPYPVERTLLVSGVLESCLTSSFEGQKRMETPHLDVRYQAPRQSQHTRT